MDFHSPAQLIAFLRATDDAVQAGQDHFLCPICQKEAVIESAPFGQTARCPACGLSATVAK